MSTDPVETILFQTSPFGTIDGIVEHDGRVVHFYLNERPTVAGQSAAAGQSAGRFGTRACWVRNLKKGPLVIDQSDLALGKAPMMPRNDCLDGQLHRLPDADSLEIIWFEEGNGAALLETTPGMPQRTIAVIPPWSGIDGFHGYASNCAHETPLAWPMPANPALQLRIERAAEFWNSFTNDSSPFTGLQQNLLECFDEAFGAENQQQYYSIDGGRFPPRGLVRYQTGDQTILLTVGMSLCPQPSVELATENPAQRRRIEIGVRVPHHGKDPDPQRMQQTMQAISSWAAHPWRNQTWLGGGHTIDWSVTHKSANLVSDQQINMPGFRGDPLGLLWIETSP